MSIKENPQGALPSSLVDKLHALNRLNSPLHSRQDLLNRKSCALNSGRCPECRGHGIVFSPKGFYAQAMLCSCVLKCAQCIGKAVDVSSGSAVACKNPSPIIMANLFNQAQIPVRYAHAKVGKFANKTGNYAEICKKIIDWLALIKSTGVQNKGVILSGDVGVGKTYLLTSIAKEMVFKGFSVKFVDFFQLITEIKARYSQKKDVADSILGPLLTVDVLIIDELGKGRRTEFEQTIVDQLVMGRYNQNKLMLASTNCKLELAASKPLTQQKEFNKSGYLIEEVGERIFSRLKETCHFWTMTGEDYRYRQGS